MSIDRVCTIVVLDHDIVCITDISCFAAFPIRARWRATDMRTATAVIYRRNHFTRSNCNHLCSDCRLKICCTVPVAVAVIPTGSNTILGRDRPCIFSVRCPRLRLWYCAKDRQRTEQHCHAKQAGQPSFDIPHFHIKPSFLVWGIVPSFGTPTVSSYCACTDLSITFIIFTLLNSCCFFWGDSNKGLLHRMPCSSPCYHYKIFSYASAVIAATASTMAPSTMR